MAVVPAAVAVAAVIWSASKAGDAPATSPTPPRPKGTNEDEEPTDEDEDNRCARCGESPLVCSMQGCIAVDD